MNERMKEGRKEGTNERRKVGWNELNEAEKRQEYDMRAIIMRNHCVDDFLF